MTRRHTTTVVSLGALRIGPGVFHQEKRAKLHRPSKKSVLGVAISLVGYLGTQNIFDDRAFSHED